MSVLWERLYYVSQNQLLATVGSYKQRAIAMLGLDFLSGVSKEMPSSLVQP